MIALFLLVQYKDQKRVKWSVTICSFVVRFELVQRNSEAFQNVKAQHDLPHNINISKDSGRQCESFDDSRLVVLHLLIAIVILAHRRVQVEVLVCRYIQQQ